MSKRWFKHYKGGIYELVALAKSSETLEDLVVYRSCLEPEKVWVRPARMFFEDVEVPVVSYGEAHTENVPRFREIDRGEKSANVNWRHNSCPGAGQQPLLENIIRQPDRQQSYGRTACHVCNQKNIGFSSNRGINKHRQK